MSIKKDLPEDAQQMFVEVFNSAEEASGKGKHGKPNSSDDAQKAAWEAVKKSYRREGDSWVKKEDDD